ncbi:hypothetical protein D3C74_428250 [compost metagenome]
MWLRTRLKEEMAQEFQRGRDARAAGNDRTQSLSKLRHMWLKPRLAAGRYDIGDEDRSVYFKAYIAERAALIEGPGSDDQYTPTL